ncbi:hypothetical protein PoMZ_09288 [Pyricularia oryzae]|uniref:Uncharacterized protein n=1 Tax=Pyricularia oryzae TaxID=318829 RepID=A0A4P7N1A7_PYROR|nr:hypothetical protein PoMZ_09288 [Pyricularia oryzae]
MCQVLTPENRRIPGGGLPLLLGHIVQSDCAEILNWLLATFNKKMLSEVLPMNNLNCHNKGQQSLDFQAVTRGLRLVSENQRATNTTRSDKNG